MKFLIEIKGNTQPELIRSLDEARKHLIAGGCYLNVCGWANVVMSPASVDDEDEFRKLHELAHPRPTAPWTKDGPR